MTIRFTCDECGSVLKIKDELAGTDGKCPKCKKKFIVPQPDDSPDEPVAPKPTTKTPAERLAPEKPVAEKPAAKPAAPPAPPGAKGGKKPSNDDDFDPVSFLMDEPKKKPATFNPRPIDDEPSGGGLSLDDDPAGDAPAPAPKRWGAKKDTTTAAEAAGRSLGGGAATGNAARDLLAKSMEESRVRAGEMPEEKPRFDFDFVGFFKEFGVKGCGLLAVILVGTWWLYGAVNGMMGGQLQLPELGYVEGTVTYKGKPLSGVTVYFAPVETEIKGSKERWRASTGRTNESGQFTLHYVEGIEGVKTGRCQVSIESLDYTVVIPEQYTMRGGTTIEVSKGSNPPYNIDIK